MTFTTLPLEVKLLIIAKFAGDHLTPGRLGSCNKELANLGNQRRRDKLSHFRLQSALQFYWLRLDIVLVILLTSLPFLESLEIGLGHGNYTGFDNDFLVDDLVQDILCKIPSGTVLIDSKPVLQRLTHLKIECRDSSAGDPLPLMSWLQLPSLTHFFGSKWGSHNLEENDIKNLPNRFSPSIIHREFRDYALTAPYLHRLLTDVNSSRP
ncbi:hypothetical protein N7508_001113 [Penicillium antarcticum]|uniref:uncharacterized protein n=1 Tax=Penicillium antarcticum TaxID=416450 RepID=UPI00238456F3|nr:uncharacterized protein N7508_001113 [Penicillium antarcticum]KAJ5316605.1 hypothetical protein N7508_001113 [Penicillium antarcticum]